MFEYYDEEKRKELLDASADDPDKEVAFRNILVGVLIAVAIGAVMFLIMDDAPQNRRSRATASTSPQPAPTAKRGEVTASVYCPSRVESLGQYAHRWTDGFTGVKFTHTRTTSNPAVVTYIGDSIEFQNGFGAWQPHVYECDLNVETKQILDVRARPGRLN